MKASIEHLSSDQSKTYRILENNLEKLTDLEFVFNKTNALEKQELINMVFDQKLYYQEGMYRTPTMIDGSILKPVGQVCLSIDFSKSI